MTRISILGGTGYAGSHIINAATSRGHQLPDELDRAVADERRRCRRVSVVQRREHRSIRDAQALHTLDTEFGRHRTGRVFDGAHSGRSNRVEDRGSRSADVGDDLVIARRRRGRDLARPRAKAGAAAVTNG